MPPEVSPEAIALRRACVGALERFFRAVGLVPPDIVQLHPAAQVHGEVLVGRFQPQEQAVLEAGCDAQVAADHGRCRRLRGWRRLNLRIDRLRHCGVADGRRDLALPQLLVLFLKPLDTHPQVIKICVLSVGGPRRDKHHRPDTHSAQASIPHALCLL